MRKLLQGSPLLVEFHSSLSVASWVLHSVLMYAGYFSDSECHGHRLRTFLLLLVLLIMEAAHSSLYFRIVLILVTVSLLRSIFDSSRTLTSDHWSLLFYAIPICWSELVWRIVHFVFHAFWIYFCFISLSSPITRSSWLVFLRLDTRETLTLSSPSPPSFRAKRILFIHSGLLYITEIRNFKDNIGKWCT